MSRSTVNSTLSDSRSERIKNALPNAGVGKAVLIIRLIFLAFLVGIAVALGVTAYYIVAESEKGLGEKQFNLLAERALDLVHELALRRRVVVKSIAQIAATAFPDAFVWPNVVIPGPLRPLPKTC